MGTAITEKDERHREAIGVRRNGEILTCLRSDQEERCKYSEEGNTPLKLRSRLIMFRFE